MSLTRLPPAEARLALLHLFEHLAPSRSKGLQALIALADTEGLIILQAALDALYPGKARDAALNAFGVFRSDVRKSAEEAGIQFLVGIDRQTQSSPSERHCWLEGEDLLMPELERQQKAFLATNTEYRAENFQPPSAKQTGPRYPVFISSSDNISAAASAAEKRLIKDFLDLLRLQLRAKNRPDLADGIWHFREHQENGMHLHMQQAIQSCRIGLLLFSDAYMASDYIKKQELPHFTPARVLAKDPNARDSIAIMLSGCGADDNPSAINRLLGTDHGEFGFQILRYEDSQHFAKCSSENKRRFAAQIAERLIAKFPSHSDEAKNTAEEDYAAETRYCAIALQDARQCDYHYRDFERTRARKASLERAGHKAAEGDEQEGFDVIQHLMDWAALPDGANLHALLGELGSGKTFTCRMFAQHLLEKRKTDPASPLPVYIDLREIHLPDSSGSTVPTLDDILTGWQGNWQRADNKLAPLSIERLKQLMAEGRLLVIFDGFDEISMRLPRNSDQQFLRELWRMATFGGKVLISCRSHYFPSLSAQNALLLDEARGTVAANRRETRDAQLECTGTELLPFTEEQVRSYLVRSRGEEEAQRAWEIIASTHNLRDLASRAYLLRLIRDHVDELAAQHEAGQAINAASLYRLFINDWLQRDHGKEVIEPPDKLELMERLAIQLWQSPQRSWSYTELRKWVLKEIASDPGWYFLYQPKGDLIAKDLHTAAFLVREGDENFRFAHSSLHEYFVAARLLSALQAGEFTVWDVAGLSRETLIFFGEQIELLSRADHDKALAALDRLHAKPPTPQAALLALDYLLLAQEFETPLPHRLPAELDLSHTNLFQRHLAPLATPRWNLRRLTLTGALANQAHFDHLHIARLDAADARLASSCWQHCEVGQADFSRAELAGAEFRHSRLADADFSGANLHDSRFRHSQVQHHVNAADDPLAPVWDLHSSLTLAQHPIPVIGQLSADTGHHSGLSACAFSPDGRTLLSASWDSTLRLWDAISGNCLHPFEGHTSGVSACVFSPKGDKLLSASWDKTLRLWDAASGACLQIFEGHAGMVAACAFSSDGDSVLSASHDNTLRLWDAASGACMRIFEGHTSLVSSCAFSPDGTTLLSASYDKTLRLWDAASGACLRGFEGHTSSVTACAFSPDGGTLLSASWDKTLRLWDAVSGACLRIFEGHTNMITAGTFSSDGASLLSASHDNTLRLWDTTSGTCRRIFEGHTSAVSACTFSPDGTSLLSASHDIALRLWDAVSGSCLRSFEGHASMVTACAFSPDGASLLSASHDQPLRLWDVASGKCLRTFEGHTGAVSTCAFSPDGVSLLSASWDKTLRLWDAVSGKCLRTFEGHTGAVTACAFSPDGIYLLSASHDHTLRLWDAASGECVRTFEGHSGAVAACAFSPNGSTLLSASHDNTLRLWEAASGKCVRLFEGHASIVTACAFSPDGISLLSASWDGSLRLWNAASGACLRTFEGHSGMIGACAFSPSGASLLSASWDKGLRLWNAASGECLRTFEDHTSMATACAFGPDGISLLSANWDGSLRLWNTASGQTLWSVQHFKDGGLVWRDARGEVIRANDAAWPYLGYFANEADGRPIWVPLEVCDIGAAA